ncbi:MAG: DNA-3-methyladenine glycosylase I [Candidatus Cyclobacteriaceae bacterium M3_2C_046]
MELQRCAWVENTFPQYVTYHDEEWGVPVHDDKIHFEFLILEGAQAGLSWSTVLRKREGYRKAFANFDPEKVAKFGDNQINTLLQNSNIIRNKLKIRSAINNADRFMKIQDEFGSFDHYIWSFVDHKPIVNHWESLQSVPATSAASDQLSRDLKKRGFSFVGSTIIYAHMQACGLVNDHTLNCYRHRELIS